MKDLKYKVHGKKDGEVEIFLQYPPEIKGILNEAFSLLNLNLHPECIRQNGEYLIAEFHTQYENSQRLNNLIRYICHQLGMKDTIFEYEFIENPS